MTVLEFMRSFNDLATRKSYLIEVVEVPGDGSSNRVHIGNMKDERYMRPGVRKAEISSWFILSKDSKIVVATREVPVVREARNDNAE